MKIMKFDIWSKYLNLRESVKDDELNRILDKISAGTKLSDREQTFLKRYDDILDDDIKDLSHISKNDAFVKISTLLDRGKKVICDLYDRDGQIGDEIVGITNDFQSETCDLKLKHGEQTKLHDRFLYNLKYNFQNDTYSLTSQDEYSEKIPVGDEN